MPQPITASWRGTPKNATRDVGTVRDTRAGDPGIGRGANDGETLERFHFADFFGPRVPRANVFPPNSQGMPATELTESVFDQLNPRKSACMPVPMQNLI